MINTHCNKSYKMTEILAHFSWAASEFMMLALFVIAKMCFHEGVPDNLDTCTQFS